MIGVRSRRALIVVAVVSLLGVAATAAATASTDTRGGASASAVKVGFIYSRTGALSGFGAEEFEGFQYGPQVAEGAAQHVRRPQAQRQLRRRPDEPDRRRQRGEGSHRSGLQDHRRLDVVGFARRWSRRSRIRTTSSSSRGLRPRTRSPASTGTRSAPAGRATRTSRPRRTSCRRRASARRSSSSPRTRRSARATSRRCSRCSARKGHTVSEDLRAVPGGRPDAVRAAAEEHEGRPRLRRVGRLELGRDVAVAQPAEGARRRRDVATGLADRVDLRHVRPARRPGGEAALELHLPGPEEQGEHVARQADEGSTRAMRRTSSRPTASTSR